MTKLQSGHECVYLFTLIPIIWNFKMIVWPWPLRKRHGFKTHCLDVVDSCAKLFQIPSMYDKVTVRTRMKRDGRTDGQTDGAIILCLATGHKHLFSLSCLKLSILLQNYASFHIRRTILHTGVFFPQKIVCQQIIKNNFFCHSYCFSLVMIKVYLA
jgi:hypothetical protein